MALNFPNSPVDGQTYLDTSSGNRYVYDSANTLWKYASNNNILTTSNNQVIFNNNGAFSGSNGLTFTANTLYVANVNTSLNVVAQYYFGNGAFLTGVSTVSDLTPANNWANTIARDWANTRLANVVAGQPITISWSTTNGYTNATVNISTTGVTAASYGNATIIPSFTVDSYGRITAASNVSVSSGITVTDEAASATTYYPLLSQQTSGSESTANVSSTKLYFVPSTGTLSATIFNSLSDSQYKVNVQSIEHSIELLNRIRPVSFNWKETGHKSYGVIAQELEKILPELVNSNREGVKSVSYDPLIAILIDVVQKQQIEIEEMKKLLNSIVIK